MLICGARTDTTDRARTCPAPARLRHPGVPAMRRAEQPSRRTVLAAAVAAAVTAGAGPAAADPEAPMTTDPADPARAVPARTVDNRAWVSYTDWSGGTAKGTRGRRGHPPGPGDREARRNRRLHGSAHRQDRHVGVRHLDLSRPPARRPRDRGDRLLERAHPGRHLDPGRDQGHLHRRHQHPLVRDGPLGRRRPGHPAHLGRRPGRRQEHRLDRHPGHRRRVDRPAPGLVPAAPDPLPQARHQGHTHRVADHRHGLRRARPVHRPGVRARASRKNWPSRATRRRSTRASTPSTTTAARPGAARRPPR
ncbi:hypothetical protein QFZ55_001451 [Streptomyces luteogriseus]|nr:hypothetical protein [Streptomyces luteogriseus]